MTSAPARTALVTGGGAGIGLAAVGILLEAGWRVCALDRSAVAIDAARAGLAGHGDRLRWVVADVTDGAAVGRVVADLERGFGPLRGLVTCAGLAASQPFLATSADEMRRLYDINVIGTVEVAKAAAEAMRRAGGGAIVTMASVSGLVGNVGRAAYGASKGAIVALTRVMAVELARHGIRVNAIAPGPIETAMTAAVHTAEARAQWNASVPLRRYGTPAEVGQAIAFLLDEARSSYITGQILSVDGGFVAGRLVDQEWQGS